MTTLPRPNLDRIAIALSGLCAVHCVATTVVLVGMSAAGGISGNPAIHEVGLCLAIVLGAVALGRGVQRHRRMLPLAIGASGLVVMAAAMTLGHGHGESVATIAGVALLAGAHRMNQRCGATLCCREGSSPSDGTGLLPRQGKRL